MLISKDKKNNVILRIENWKGVFNEVMYIWCW